ncbi:MULTISPECIES: aminotransferase class I/II-fold pyridoxal phosphate-dependent enzyme [Saccharothrix]|uniref:aminotransferase class I/II-fold pyridoxal phosphate-dependent enzyme n=1 Tax=Saccharothrix TaxID=2071 RepID=UPI000939EB35|nr:aminotransferase class I/II-fold pyridoxal phosphate-dependent enzyme [Saccharothrix sp. CB00851]OKI36919.1 hypothetical protein A6A25_20715 [Saccharothrix sp. CB00851]
MSNDSTARIVAGLRAWIAQAPPGARMPSNRALMAQYGAGPVTVQKAMHALASAGLVESRPGVGTFVRAVRTVRPPDYGWQTGALRSPRAPVLATPLRGQLPDAIGLHSGYPDRALLPERLVRAALARAARADTALARSDTAGLPELRAWFAGELGQATPTGVAPPAARDVVVLPGSQSGLSSIFRALVGAGRPLLAESMYVSGVLQAAALDVVTQFGWRTHLRALRHELRARRDLLVDSLAEHVPDAHLEHVPPGGLNLWARLPDETDRDRLARDCEAEGVVIAPGAEWFPAEPSGSFIRLNFSGPDPDRFPDAARIIGRALARASDR